MENKIDSETSLVGITDELHKRLRIQAENLLFEYRLGSGSVPHEHVEKLMRLYGSLIVQLIFDDLKKNSAPPKKRLKAPNGK